MYGPRAPLSLVLAVLAFGRAATAGPMSTVVDFGPINARTVTFSGVDDSGHLFGNVSYGGQQTRAFLYDVRKGGEIASVPGTSGADPADPNRVLPASDTFITGVSKSGRVVGARGSNNARKPFELIDGSSREIGPAMATANAVNSSGQVAGTTTDGSPILRDSKTGEVRPLGVPSGWSSVRPVALNDSGAVAGTADNTKSALADPSIAYQERAMLALDGTFRDLGTLGGKSSSASGMNALGQVVGISELADGSARAFFYSNGTMHDLGTLPGSSNSYARSINDSGDVVGISPSNSPGGLDRSFLYRDGKMMDINSLIDPNAGWSFQYADRIDNQGRIYGTARDDRQGGQHAVMIVPSGLPIPAPPIFPANPVPEPSAAWPVVAGVLGLLVRRSRRSRGCGGVSRSIPG